MPVTVTNIKPAVLTPYYTSSLKDDYDVNDIMTQLFIKPLRTPLVTNAPVVLKNGNGKDITDNDIISNITDCCDSEFWQPMQETYMKQLMSASLADYNSNTAMSFRNIYQIQAAETVNRQAGSVKMPEPNSNVIYQSSEVIQASADFIAGRISYEELFATFAFYEPSISILGFYFVNETEWQNFINAADNQISLISANLSSDTISLWNDFKTLSLDKLTESIRIRNNDSESLEPYSFARLIVNLLINYSQNSGLMGLFPVNVSELIIPKCLVFFNIEKFAHTTPSNVWTEFNDIKSGMNLTKKISMVSQKKLMRLAVLPQNLRKTTAASSLSASNKNSMDARSSRTVFKQKMPDVSEYIKLCTKIIKSIQTNRITMNTYKFSKPSFQKPNRRNPDDWNKQGVITSTRYSPDLHLYIDCSGSITSQDYTAAVKSAVLLAKKMNVNLYFNSFSHIMSQTVRLDCKDKSVAEILKTFQKVPKVGGGTDFRQIWDFINKSKKRQEEFSIIISDMEYYAPSEFVKHPKYLYYMPILTRYNNMSALQDMCTDFINSCKHNDINIRRKILL